MPGRDDERLSLSRRSLVSATAAAAALTSIKLPFPSVRAESSPITTGERIEIPADPDAGFNYPYLLYVPAAATDTRRPLLVEPNNTGQTSDDLDVHRDRAESRLAPDGRTRELCDELAIPAIVPIFPRPSSDPVDWTHYTHALDRESLSIDGGPLERIDQQLLAMADDARSRMADDLGMELLDDILMNGFSATGNFVNRFCAIHPTEIRAAIAGGINGTAVLPREDHDGHSLSFHVGVADLPSLIGSSFDQSAWQTVDQFVYLGGDDENDTIPYDDAWTGDWIRELALDVYGDHMQLQRMPTCRQLYEDAGFTGWFRTYPNTGHTFLMDEMLTFLSRHTESVTVRFDRPPAIGAESVAVDAHSWPEEADHELRVFDANDADITAAAVTLPADGDVVEDLPLDRPLEADESITVAAVDPASPTLDSASAQQTTSVTGVVSFDETPTAGDDSVAVSYELSTGYSPSVSVSLRLDTEEGGATQLTTVEPGEDGSTTASLDLDAFGVPLHQDREVRLLLVEDDPAGTDPIAETRTSVAPADELITSIESIESPRIIEVGDDATLEVTVQALGGPADGEQPVTVTLDGEVLAETVTSPDIGELETVDISLEPDGHGAQEVTVEVGDETATQTFFVASEPEGTGQASSPYEVTTSSELAYADIDPDAHFELTEDIDLSAVDSFVRIGTHGDRFTGTFDGGGHRISHVSIEAATESFEGVGLFGNLAGDAHIHDLVIEDADIEGTDTDFVGLLAGGATDDVLIERVRTTGTVSGDRHVAGIVGGTTSGGSLTIRECSSGGTITAASNTSGGIVGQLSGQTVEQCYFDGVIDDDGELGGGIVGQSWFGSTVHECYASGEIVEPGGGIIARVNDDADVQTVYWDIEATGQDDSAGGGEGLSTEEMTGEAATANLVGFDFEEIWTVTDGYPQLAHEDGLSLLAQIEVDPADPSPGDSVTFTADPSIGDVVAYEWSVSGFDDDLPDAQSVTVTFESAGEYEMNLTVVDAEGDTDTTAKSITVQTESTTAIAFAESPVAGATTVDIEYELDAALDGDSYRGRVGDESGNELTESPLGLIPGSSDTETAELIEPLAAGEELTAVVQPPGGYDPDAALAMDTTIVESADIEIELSVAEPPSAGSDIVRVSATVPEAAFADEYEIRVGDADGTDLTAAPVSVEAGESVSNVAVTLDRTLEDGEELIVVLQEPGSFAGEDATETTSTSVGQADPAPDDDTIPGPGVVGALASIGGAAWVVNWFVDRDSDEAS